MTAKQQGSIGASYCKYCKKTFEYATRDLFKGELFCPHCAARALVRYKNLTEANKENRI